MRTTLALATAVVLLLEIPTVARQPSWKMSATVAESCSCTVSCPCNFGGEPSRMPCEGNRMISIDSGSYDGVDLAGVQLLVTFNMRNWSKIYVSDKVGDRQMKAVEALLPLAFAGFHKGMLSFTKAPITMEATETRVKFSGPESSVDMEVKKGFNGQAGKGAEPAKRGVPGLHAVPLGLAHPHQRRAFVEPQGHQRLHLEMGAASSK